jgi:hypothetical protein
MQLKIKKKAMGYKSMILEITHNINTTHNVDDLKAPSIAINK